MAKAPSASCSIENSLGVLGERWTFLILREAFFGASRFAQFRDNLGVAPDVLSDRLTTLVEYGVMERRALPGPRHPRSGTPIASLRPAMNFQLVLSALQQWGDEHVPGPDGPSMLRRCGGTDRPVQSSATSTSVGGRSSPLTSPWSRPRPTAGNAAGGARLRDNHHQGATLRSVGLLEGDPG